MSDSNINEILKRLQKQDDALAKLQEQMEPINKMFQNAEGFGRVMIALMKIIGLIGVASGALYGAWVFVKFQILH